MPDYAATSSARLRRAQSKLVPCHPPLETAPVTPFPGASFSCVSHLTAVWRGLIAGSGLDVVRRHDLELLPPLSLAHLVERVCQLLACGLVLGPRTRRDLHPGDEARHGRHRLERRTAGRGARGGGALPRRRRGCRWEGAAAAEHVAADLLQLAQLGLVAVGSW